MTAEEIEAVISDRITGVVSYFHDRFARSQLY